MLILKKSLGAGLSLCFRFLISLNAKRRFILKAAPSFCNEPRFDYFYFKLYFTARFFSPGGLLKQFAGRALLEPARGDRASPAVA